MSMIHGAGFRGNLDASGNLKVNIQAGAGSGGTASTDEAAFTAASTVGTPAMGVFETSPTTLANNQVGIVGVTNDRKLKVSGSFSSMPIIASTSALTNVAESATSVTLLAANANRLAVEIMNDSDGVLLAKAGVTASATSYSWRIPPRSSLTTQDMGVNYTGRIDGIWETAPGTAGHASARVTELTA